MSSRDLDLWKSMLQIYRDTIISISLAKLYTPAKFRDNLMNMIEIAERMFYSLCPYDIDLLHLYPRKKCIWTVYE